MMGQVANSAVWLRSPQGMGFAPAVAAVAPAAGPLAPIILAVAAVLPLLTKYLNFGYNPRKLNDTAITEAVKGSLNVLWYNLTGEALNGVHRTAEPGQYGAQHIALFTGSQYPNVPYPAGPADAGLIQQVIAQAQQIIAQGRSNLVRQESYQGYDFNANYMLGLMQQVADARARENPLAEFIPSGAGIMSWLPWLIGGYAVYKLVL